MLISTKENVAIKIIKKKFLKGVQLEKVQSEIDIMKFNKHPNLVKYLDSFENSEFYFIVMEYARHGNLYSFLRNKTLN